MGISAVAGTAFPRFEWQEPSEAPIKETALHETHRKLGAKMVPFAGWDMPVWYSSVVEEHLATRTLQVCLMYLTWEFIKSKGKKPNIP